MVPGEAGHTPDRVGLAADFAGIARALYLARTVEETLRRIVALSASTIDGCSAAGISLVQGDETVTPVCTEPKVLEIDDMQYSTRQGPSLDAISRGEIVYAEDLLTDPRWRRFGPMAAEAGMRSLLSFSLFGEATLGALNLYSQQPRAFGATERAEGLIYATHAGVALAAAVELEHANLALAVETKRLRDLHGALASREVIGQAEGILMQRELITADQAFDLLRRASQRLNIKLREVARYVVDTGDIPTTADESRLDHH